MTDRLRHKEDLQLRRLLKAGDPAADGRDPDSTELGRWRRQALTATEAASRTPLWRRPWMPLAAAATAALLAVVFLLPSEQPGESSSLAIITQQVPAGVDASLPNDRPELATDAPAEAPGQQIPTLAQDPSPPRTASIPTPAPSRSDAPPAAVVLAASRTVRFTAPGGTRIIWTLNPDLELPTEGDSL